MTEITLTINGQPHTLLLDPAMPLLYALRNDLALVGPKFGCGLGQCGACTVLVGDQAVRSCIYPVSQVIDQPITTLEGLGSQDDPHPLQQAFIDQQAAQCGYCLNGMIMTAEATLRANPSVTEIELKQVLSSNLCRCGAHLRILKAIRQAAQERVDDA